MIPHLSSRIPSRRHGAPRGIKQNLKISEGVMVKERTPHTLLYMGGGVVRPLGNDRVVVPYAVAGVGGLTLLDVAREDAPITGLARHETYTSVED